MEQSGIIEVLCKNTLFKNISLERIAELLEKLDYRIFEASTDSLISSENEPCDSIGFVLYGKVVVYKSNPSGSNVVVKTIIPGDYYGEALVFSTFKDCPSSIVANKNTAVLMITAENILKLCELEPQFLRNMLVSLSNKVFLLNSKIKLLSYTSVRQRLASYLLDESERSGSLSFSLDKTREELGELLGIARPSVSRELSNMYRDGLIEIAGKRVKILDRDKLSSLL